MPGYKAHLVGGAAAASCLLYLFPQSPMLMLTYMVSALAGALFPDIDTKSKGQIIFYRLFLCLFVMLIATKQFHVATFFSVLLFVPILARHRGIFHRVWFLCTLSVCACVYIGMCATTAYSVYASRAVLFFLVGALSHVWLDIGVRGMIRWK